MFADTVRAYAYRVNFWVKHFQREVDLKLAEKKASRMVMAGMSYSAIATALAPEIGCPCSGPAWWQDIVVRSYQERGEKLPPELAEVKG